MRQAVAWIVVLSLTLLAVGGETPSASLFRKEPYVVVTSTATAMRVQWQTYEDATCTVSWGKSARCAEGSCAPMEADSHIYAAVLSDLTPGTVYHYCVAANDQRVQGQFTTAPQDPTAPDLVFYGIGDAQLALGDDKYFPELCMRMAREISENPDRRTFCLVAGDWIESAVWGVVNWITSLPAGEASKYSGQGSPARSVACWDGFFARAHPLLAEVPLVGCVGNHDVQYVPSQTSLFDSYWPYPYVDGHYWSMDWGPVHLTIVDDYTPCVPGSPQYEWLTSDLQAASARPWTVVLKHEPGSPDAGAELFTLFQEHGVDLVIGGHWHNDWFFGAAVLGAPELVMSLSAKDSYGYARKYPSWGPPMYYRFEIHGRELNIHGIDSAGEVVVSYTIQQS